MTVLAFEHIRKKMADELQRKKRREKYKNETKVKGLAYEISGNRNI